MFTRRFHFQLVYDLFKLRFYKVRFYKDLFIVMLYKKNYAED